MEYIGFAIFCVIFGFGLCMESKKREIPVPVACSDEMDDTAILDWMEKEYFHVVKNRGMVFVVHDADTGPLVIRATRIRDAVRLINKA